MSAKCAKPGCGAQRIIGSPCADWDCPQQTVAAEEYAKLKARCSDLIDYSIDLQRIIEDICKKRDISPPGTLARHHYFMAMDYRAALSQANPPSTPPEGREQNT
jgi:hypothetical protein